MDALKNKALKSVLAGTQQNASQIPKPKIDNMKNPSRTDTQNGNYPNNAEETNSSATWWQRLDESHQTSNWFQQEGRRNVPRPPAFVSPMRHHSRGSAANCLSAEQARKRSMMLVNKALLIIDAEDEVEHDDSLSKSCLSPPSPRQ